ncbi:MAG: hypothetical protein V7742_14050 [Halioglobus sp.]
MATNRAPKKTKPTESQSPDDSHILLIREDTCPSNTGKSTLGYSIGKTEAGDVHFKLSSNTGGGNFSSSWISFKDVEAALKAWPKDQAVTSMAIRPVCQTGRSANDLGFLTAVLLAEGLLENLPRKSRTYQAIDPKLFKAKVEALKAGGGIPAKQPAQKSKAKPAAKAKSKSPAAKGKAK